MLWLAVLIDVGRAPGDASKGSDIRLAMHHKMPEMQRRQGQGTTGTGPATPPFGPSSQMRAASTHPHW
jgi:hypothetical protein